MLLRKAASQLSVLVVACCFCFRVLIAGRRPESLPTDGRLYGLFLLFQGFRMLDNGQKGYLTADDLRQAAESQKLPFSNRAIREMIQEADVTGDGKITSDEFIHIMLQTSMFKTTR